MRLDNGDQASVLTKGSPRLGVGLLPMVLVARTQKAASDQLRGQKDSMGQTTANKLCLCACAFKCM